MDIQAYLDAADERLEVICEMMQDTLIALNDCRADIRPITGALEVKAAELCALKDALRGLKDELKAERRELKAEINARDFRRDAELEELMSESNKLKAEIHELGAATMAAKDTLGELLANLNAQIFECEALMIVKEEFSALLQSQNFP